MDHTKEMNGQAETIHRCSPLQTGLVELQDTVTTRPNVGRLMKDLLQQGL